MFTFDGNTASLEAMLRDNAHDDEICAWLRAAQIGERFYGIERIA
jgi:hypothetical protein